jgi:trimeric autotransporter adhesin
VVRLTRRFNQGMSFLFSYTYSKSIADVGSSGSTVQFLHDWNLERALSTSNQPQRISFQYQLSSPVGVRGMLRNGGWKEHALAGWTLNSTITAQDATPLTPTLGGTLANLAGYNTLNLTPRAQATGLPVTASGGNSYFNLAAFTAPPLGELGDASRDSIPGPFYTTMNFQLNRAFRFGEGRKQLQFRLTANNALNHLVITRFGTTVGNANYGLPTGTGAQPRSVVLNLRFNF